MYLLQQAVLQQQYCNGDISLNGNLWIATGNRIKTRTDYKRNCHSWLCQRGDPTCQIWCKSISGGLWANAWNITKKLFYLCLCFSSWTPIKVSHPAAAVRHSSLQGTQVLTAANCLSLSDYNCIPLNLPSPSAQIRHSSQPWRKADFYLHQSVATSSKCEMRVRIIHVNFNCTVTVWPKLGCKLYACAYYARVSA